MNAALLPNWMLTFSTLLGSKHCVLMSTVLLRGTPAEFGIVTVWEFHVLPSGCGIM